MLWIYLILDTKIVFRIKIILINAGHFLGAVKDGLIVNLLQRMILWVVMTEDWVVVPDNNSDIEYIDEVVFAIPTITTTTHLNFSELFTSSRCSDLSLRTFEGIFY